MLGFFGRILSGFMTVAAIIILILGTVFGVVIVNETNYWATGGELFFGGLIGFVVSFIFDVMSFGLIGIFIEMRDTQASIRSELREIKKLMEKTDKSEDKASNATRNFASEAPKRSVNTNTVPGHKFVTCPKCGTENFSYNYICSNCGNSLR